MWIQTVSCETVAPASPLGLIETFFEKSLCLFLFISLNVIDRKYEGSLLFHLMNTGVLLQTYWCWIRTKDVFLLY